MKKQKLWSNSEIEYLKINCSHKTCEQIAIDLERTTKSVQHKYHSLKLNPYKDLPIPQVGDRHGRLVIRSITRGILYTNNELLANCLCDCGKECTVPLTKLKMQRQISCGCLRNELCGVLSISHGQSNTRLYRIWAGIKTRCYNKNTASYKDYGGRGITVCDEWLNFKSFYDWAINGYSKKLSLDRIDNNLGYFPENCRWSTNKEQCNNNRKTRIITAFGETKALQYWLEDIRCKAKAKAIIYRIDSGWSAEEAITTPPQSAETKPIGQKRILGIWRAMNNRCNNPKNNRYKNYGRRGISVCDEWRDFNSFYDWSMENGYKDNLSIDRIDNNGNYEPNNCKWETIEKQMNKTTKNKYIAAFGETKTVAEWSKDTRCLVNYHTLLMRLKHGWVAEKAINTKIIKNKRPASNNYEILSFIAFGEEKYLYEWLQDTKCVVSKQTLRYRIKNGWDFEKAISTPTAQQYKNS